MFLLKQKKYGFKVGSLLNFVDLKIELIMFNGNNTSPSIESINSDFGLDGKAKMKEYDIFSGVILEAFHSKVKKMALQYDCLGLRAFKRERKTIAPSRPLSWPLTFDDRISVEISGEDDNEDDFWSMANSRDCKSAPSSLPIEQHEAYEIRTSSSSLLILSAKIEPPTDFIRTRRGKKIVKLYCVFCKNNDPDNYKLWMSHKCKDENNRTLCPILRAHICEICGATGDRGHTLNHCPLRQAAKSGTLDQYFASLEREKKARLAAYNQEERNFGAIFGEYSLFEPNRQIFWPDPATTMFNAQNQQESAQLILKIFLRQKFYSVPGTLIPSFVHYRLSQQPLHICPSSHTSFFNWGLRQKSICFVTIWKKEWIGFVYNSFQMAQLQGSMISDMPGLMKTYELQKKDSKMFAVL
uniref:Nanos-type domain-containing protein n=1 Tax=Romanomermis culicivorax TaxID=13658 RepID=A0A915JTD4_ROMCU